jgi:hypothetical protein
MTPFDFRANDLPGSKPKRSVSIKPEMKEYALEGELPSPNATHRSGDIEEISERLANLADQINAFNTAKRSGGLVIRSVSGYLPYFGKTLEIKQSPIAYVHGTELGINEPPINAEQVENTSTALDAEGRVWPQLSPTQRPNVRALEDKIAEQSEVLTERCIQIADLSNIRQEQANELLIACDEIDCLSKSIADLQQALAQRDEEAAAATEKLILLDKENIVLQAQLTKALHESFEYSKRLLDVETELNNKTVDIATTQETVEQQKAELATLQAEKLRMETTIEEKANLRYRDELKQQSWLFDIQILELRTIVAGRDRKIKDLEAAQAELTARFECLSKTAATFEGTQQIAKNKIRSQAENIEFLETLLRVERETSEAKMRALIKEFQQERLEHYAKEQASAEIRKDTILVLPKLAMRRNESYAPEQNASISCDNAA